MTAGSLVVHSKKKRFIDFTTNQLTVVHSCKPGYKLVGAKLRLCQSNGQWTPEIPSCMYVDCGDPGTPF
ncbi:hypothetical protein EMCRGX_G026015 [Ephydatia muelleri]